MSSSFTTDAAAFPHEGPLMGLDLGTKTIGLALSNPEQNLATPVSTIQRKKFTSDAVALLKIMAERKVVGLVMGLPLNMDGTEGPRAQATRAFVRNLVRLPDYPEGLPLAFWDERLSTAAAERELIALDTKRAKRAKVIDEMAAMYILQGALDRLHTM